MSEDMLAILALRSRIWKPSSGDYRSSADVYTKYAIPYKQDGGMGFLNAMHSIEETGLIVDVDGSYRVPFNRLAEARELVNDFLRERGK